MAAKYIYDYVSSLAADYTTADLLVTPQRILTETIDKKQKIHEYDDGSIDVVTFSDVAYFNLTLQWVSISESDAGTIFDFYAAAAKANGRERTFYFKHPDGYTYTVRFLGPLSRVYTHGSMAGGRREISQVTLRVEGYKPA